ncbi:MAG: UPF0182 family protein [Syntrophobacteraceae bacterium]|nr:UPF0182 family protein [Syntrophobacteraceae bacterium]
MIRWKRWLVALGMSIVAIIGVIVAISLFFTDFLVDIWWFNSLGYELYFWQRVLYKYAVFSSVFICFFLIFFLNFRIASRFLGTSPSAQKSTPDSLAAYQRLLHGFRTGSLWIYTPLSMVLAVVIALPLYEKWAAFLLYLVSPRATTIDPVYGKNASFYLFAYPIYRLLQNRLLIAFGVLLAAIALLYLVEKGLLEREEKRLPSGVRMHLSLLVLVVSLIEIWDFLLQRYDLLYGRSHLPLFYGPGYIEMNITWPLIWACIFLLAATSLSFLYFVNSRKGLKTLIVLGTTFALALGLRYATFPLQLVEHYIVKPNEATKERPYIADNIQATLAAYHLQDVEIRNFTPSHKPAELESIPDIEKILRNTPVWDRDELDDFYRQLEDLRTYYDFPYVYVDRYTVNGVYQQVNLAARELNWNLIPQRAQSWINRHLSFTHGFGAVMTPAEQSGDEPMVWFLRGIPPRSDYGFDIEQPGIYYGRNSNDRFVIAPNSSGELDYPKGSRNVMTAYNGKGGVLADSLLKRFVFSLYFKDKNIFFTTKMLPDSKIIFRNKISTMCHDLAPYLVLDTEPHVVVTEKGLYWLQDAFTTSNLYPYSMYSSTEGGQLNYIADAVKIVIDAYNGTVNFYVWDRDDPIIKAYSRIYPGLFKNFDQMPKELKAHVRYPKTIFELQMKMFAEYHMTDPEVFYQREDVWQFPKTFVGKQSSEIVPYYLTLNLIKPSRFDFLLLQPMSPIGRDNLRSLALVGCDDPYYGKILIYNFPKGELVYGPSQIYALINQNPTISQQFSLWDQSGSRVDRGKIIVLPVGNVILYIQPVYLKASTELKIPELMRLIVSQGQVVTMKRTLEDAYSDLVQKIRTQLQQEGKRFAPTTPRPQ